MLDGLRVIRAGLAPADRIVIDGIQRARPGGKVTPQDGKIENAAPSPSESVPVAAAPAAPAKAAP
jgi:hypothetical protein